MDIASQVTFPGDLLCQGATDAAWEFARTAYEGLTCEEQPESELRRLAEDLENLLDACRRLASDFGALKRHFEINSADEPGADATDGVWDAYYEGVRYRLP